jgi:chorismate mutase
MKTLLSLREKIEATDRALLDCLKKRADLVQQVGIFKKQHDLAFEDKAREDFLLEKIIENNDTAYSNEDIIEIFRLIFKASLALQKKD